MNKSTLQSPYLLAVAAATIAVAAAQLAMSLAPFYGYDEAWHLYLSTVSPLAKALEEMAVDPHPPLYYFLLRPLIAIGPEPFWPRLLSVGATVLTVPLWYLVLRKMDLARPVALTLTLVLAVSFDFNEMGPTVRAYSLAALCMVAALWYWGDFMGVAAARPSRTAWRAMLALLTAAFWFSYYALFFSTALALASLLAALSDSKVRSGLLTAWRRFFRWPEAIGVIGAHGLGVAWFLVGYGRAGLAAPPHVSPYLYGGESTVGQFLVEGLQGYARLFTPLFGAGNGLLGLGLVAMGAVWVWLSAASVRRGAVAHTALLLWIPGVLCILFCAALVGFYPFGGYLRHQHLLLFPLLLALGIGLDLVYRRLRSTSAGALLCGLVVLAAVAGSALALRSEAIGEAPPRRPLAKELDAAFGTAADSAVYTSVYPFYILYADRFGKDIRYRRSFGRAADGWVDVASIGNPIERLRIRREWDEFEVATEGGSAVALFRDRRVFALPEPPDAGFCERLHELMAELDLPRLRILHALPNAPSSLDQAELANLCDRQGLALTAFAAGDEGATWLVERRGP